MPLDGYALQHLALRTAWEAATPAQVGAYFGVRGTPLARGTADYGIPPRWTRRSATRVMDTGSPRATSPRQVQRSRPRSIP
ncbi:hypothetical protein JJV70_02180 [Streptomyces sp. JJ66]|uniref:hypothetical protein n=1 Tax=Streptomyces sp. JJ66 TaxID=2803843 RepID=UPI001C59A3B2|nr:hypothetical protein [Streptomyces sp. JJ66]MBW1600928.1 hypothetical protein [Streptomyces sp. JJ66]